MPVEEATYHMKRCVDSGLWVPDGGKDKAAKSDDANEEESETAPEPEPSTDKSKKKSA